MIKLIVSDMDGTLLNSSKKISQKTSQAIKFAKTMGVDFTLATGRMYSSAAIFARQLNIDKPIIACNGALIKKHTSNEVLYEKSINYKTADLLYKVLEECGLYYHMYTQDRFFTKELKYTSLSYWNNNKTASDEDKIDIEVIEDFSNVCTEDYGILKFVAIEDEHPEKLLKARAMLADIKGLELSQSWHNNLEIMSENISKGNALKILAKECNINLSEIMAIGDQHNDISMIVEAGIGVAMDNAEQNVKKYANLVTSSNDEDGVAKAIMNLFK